MINEYVNREFNSNFIVFELNYDILKAAEAMSIMVQEEMKFATESWFYSPKTVGKRRPMRFMVRCKKLDGDSGKPIRHDLSLKVMVGEYKTTRHSIEVQITRGGSKGKWTFDGWLIEHKEQRKYLSDEELNCILNFITDNINLLVEYWISTTNSELMEIADCLEANVRGKDYYDNGRKWTDGNKTCLPCESDVIDTRKDSKKLGKYKSGKKRY